MKKILTALAFCLTASTASAADAVYEAPQAPIANDAPMFSWTGFNAGIQGGYAWNNQDLELVGLPLTFTGDFDGGLAGAFIGYNYQFSNNWVAGIEGDFEKNWGDDSQISFFGQLDYGMDWQGSVRGRIGYAIDRALVYGTAGWAIGRGEVSAFGAGTEKATFNGYTVGVGVDYAFTDMVFGRVEYRYTNFGDKDFDLGGTIINSDMDQHAIRVGLGVKF